MVECVRASDRRPVDLADTSTSLFGPGPGPCRPGTRRHLRLTDGTPSFQTVAARFQLLVLLDTLLPHVVGRRLAGRDVRANAVACCVSLTADACDRGSESLSLHDGRFTLTHRPGAHGRLLGLPLPLLGVYYDCPFCSHRVRPVTTGPCGEGPRGARAQALPSPASAAGPLCGMC